MKEQCKFKESCSFKNNIAEITSISLECNYDSHDNQVEGTFLVEGSYRSHELSLNQDNFSFKLPFTYTLEHRAKNDTINLNVIDFTYTTEDADLNVNIEYEVTYEEEPEITSKEEFDRFLSEHEVEIVDLNEEQPIEKTEDSKEDIIKEEVVIPEDDRQATSEIEEEKDERIDDINITEINTKVQDDKVTDTIIDNIKSRDDEYITYHVYICTEYDTLNSIADKFKVTIDTLKSYNSIENINVGMKIIIPNSDEEN